MTRSNVRKFGAYVAAVGLGLTATSLWFGADVGALSASRVVTVWDYFLGVGVVMLAIGTPLYLLSSTIRYLHGAD